MATATQPNPTATPKKDDGVAIMVPVEVASMIDSAYNCQSDIENPSKFGRAFVFDAVKNHLRYIVAQNINKWEAVIDKVQRLHPTMTREQAIAELLVSRTAREMKERADKAAALKATL